MNIAKIIADARNVTANNEKFKKLTKREKRVAVAKDAIAQLLVGGYKAEPGIYAAIGGSGSLDSLFGPGMPQCRVCGIGSALLSEFRLNGSTGGLYTVGRGAFAYSGEGSGLFGAKMLREMENAFERRNLAGYCGDSNCKICKSDTNGFIENAEARLFAILNNIVENGGDYKPTRFGRGSADARAKAEAKAKANGKKIEARYAKLKVKALAAT